MSPADLRRHLQFVAITDRRLLGGEDALVVRCRRLYELGVRTILLREKDLSATALRDLALRILPAARNSGGILLISGAVDVAMSCGAQGVHLGGAARPWREARQSAGTDLLVGCSCHSAEELSEAASAGADYAFLSPFAAPLSKVSDLAPLGAAGFAVLARNAAMPVVALGGICASNAAQAMAAGAAGVAAITLFMTGDDRDIASLVGE